MNKSHRNNNEGKKPDAKDYQQWDFIYRMFKFLQKSSVLIETRTVILSWKRNMGSDWEGAQENLPD